MTPSSRARALALVALPLIFGSACSTTPITNRTQLRLVPPANMRDMAFDAYEEMVSEETLIESGDEVNRILRVGLEIARAAEEGDFAWGERGKYEWDFKVIRRDDVVNAWALPGGKVAVYTGILKVARDDDELATVLGHEIAHAILQHGNERFSMEWVAKFGETTLDAALKSKSSEMRELAKESFGIFTEKGVVLPYSRDHELEADEVGLMLMASAGYDPAAATRFWQRMSEQSSGDKTPELLSTHPSHENRISKIEEKMPEAVDILEGKRKL